MKFADGEWLRLAQSGELARLAEGCASGAALARKLGVSPDAVQKALSRLAAKGVAVPVFGRRRLVQESKAEVEVRAAPIWAGKALAEFDAMPAYEPVVPEGHVIGGVSSYVVDGEVRGQWVKTKAQDDEREAWLTAIRSLADTLPRMDPAPAPAYADEDLLVVLPAGDPHVGLLSWHEDAGENFDLDIAERNLVGAFRHLIDLAPPAAHALLIFIGDNTHADGQANTTTKGTRVDVDGRTVKMVRTIISAIRRAVDLSLAKFGHSTLIIERGNHDELLSAMIALALSLLYEREPRVTVDTSPEVFHWFRFGKNLIGTHHGDKVKPMDLLGVMAVDRAHEWSETKHRRFYCGHYHHQIVKEVPGVIVEYLPTLASSDAWHRSMGYRSARAMYMDVLHKEHGHINRHIVGIDRLRGAA